MFNFEKLNLKIMKRTLINIILILASYCYCFSQNITPELRKALNRAEAAKEIAKKSNIKEDWLDALNEYKNAARIDSTYSLIYYELGYESEAIEDYDNAIKYYNKFIMLDPKSTIADKVQTNVDKLEYKRDKNKKQIQHLANIQGIWKSDWKNGSSGTPFWIFTINQFENDIRVSVSPKSYLYKSDFTYPTAIAKRDGNKLTFMFTNDITINPKEDLDKAANVLSTLDVIQTSRNPLANSDFGTAASILKMIPTAKESNERTTYLFVLNISDSNQITGKCNVKKYVTITGSTKTKTVSDDIAEFKFSRIKQNEIDLIKRKAFNSKRRPGTAFFLSYFLPGGGQFYNKQYVDGALLAAGRIAGVLLLVTSDDQTLGIIVTASALLLSCIDAPITAIKINKQNGFAFNKIYENKNLSVKLNPNISTINLPSKPFISTGFGLTFNF